MQFHSQEVAFSSSPLRPATRLSMVQHLAQPRDRIFEFFSDAFQLESITPPRLRFNVLTPAPIRIAAGTLIDYRLRLHNIPLRWRTRISEWEPPSRFVDEQLRGPYRLWRHEHRFEETPDGTLCYDTVDYRVPGGLLVDRLFVRRELRAIFHFRRDCLAQILGTPH